MFRIAPLLVLIASTFALAADKPLKLLFLGDNGHHQPAERFRAASAGARKIAASS